MELPSSSATSPSPTSSAAHVQSARSARQRYTVTIVSPSPVFQAAPTPTLAAISHSTAASTTPAFPTVSTARRTARQHRRSSSLDSRLPSSSSTQPHPDTVPTSTDDDSSDFTSLLDGLSAFVFGPLDLTLPASTTPPASSAPPATVHVDTSVPMEVQHPVPSPTLPTTPPPVLEAPSNTPEESPAHSSIYSCTTWDEDDIAEILARLEKEEADQNCEPAPLPSPPQQIPGTYPAAN